MATHDDKYRKPLVGMWDMFLENNGLTREDIDPQQSFYIGDAAGRKKGPQRKKNDFSDNDYKFALNVGLQFQTPEMFFLEQKEELPTFDFDPKKWKVDEKEKEKFLEEVEKMKRENKEKKTMYMMVGSPGAGKSTFCKE